MSFEMFTFKWKFPSHKDYTAVASSEDMESSGGSWCEKDRPEQAGYRKQSLAMVIFSWMSCTLNVVLFAYFLYTIRWLNHGLYDTRATAIPQCKDAPFYPYASKIDLHRQSARCSNHSTRI